MPATQKLMLEADTPSSPTTGRAAFTVDLLSQIDIDYWCQIFDVSSEQLREAVQHAGHDAVDVARFLRTQRKSGTA